MAPVVVNLQDQIGMQVIQADSAYSHRHPASFPRKSVAMLVMRRRAGESFTIGDDVEIEVLEIAGTRVKLEIVAPEATPIVRKESPDHTRGEPHGGPTGGLPPASPRCLARPVGIATACQL